MTLSSKKRQACLTRAVAWYLSSLPLTSFVVCLAYLHVFLTRKSRPQSHIPAICTSTRRTTPHSSRCILSTSRFGDQRSLIRLFCLYCMLHCNSMAFTNASSRTFTPTEPHSFHLSYIIHFILILYHHKSFQNFVFTTHSTFLATTCHVLVESGFARLLPDGVRPPPLSLFSESLLILRLNSHLAGWF